jgi:hypothetical protein
MTGDKSTVAFYPRFSEVGFPAQNRLASANLRAMFNSVGNDRPTDNHYRAPQG